MKRNRNEYTTYGDICIIKTNKGDEIKIDTRFINLVTKYCWGVNNQGYAVTFSGGCRLLHHLIFGLPNKKMVTDHINRNKLDNRICNLRKVTRGVNVLNTDTKPRSNTGHRGISYVKRENRFRAEIQRDNKIITKRFKNLSDAISWREKMV